MARKTHGFELGTNPEYNGPRKDEVRSPCIACRRQDRYGQDPERTGMITIEEISSEEDV